MEIILSKNAGFCPGVRRADNAVQKLIESSNSNSLIFTLGPLIHNGNYVRDLEAKGVKSITISDAEKVILDNPGKTIILVIRTHGITKSDEAHLYNLKERYGRVEIVDLTCPSVKKIHKIAAENTNENTYFLLFGSHTHPESIGIISHINGDGCIITCAEDVKSLDLQGKVPILCAQTTQNLLQFIQIKKFLKKLYTNAIFFDTICGVTENRQYEAIEIAKKSDVMIVIGGRDSSNTQKLYSLCKEVCPKTLYIETAAELSTDFPDSAKCAGITAGASTPDGIIMEVFKAMENFSQMLTGVLTKEQITDDPDVKLNEMFKIGDQVDVFVIRVEDGKGIATVSKKRVDADNSWVVLKDAHENGVDLEGKIVSAIKGGVLLSYMGNTVFIPASQTGIAKGGDLSVLVGTTQKVRLLEFDVAKKKALGSIKVILNEEKKAQEEAIWSTLAVGNEYVGVVKNLTNYGAFVDIGGVDGMVHNSELSWKRIKHPSQVISVGQELKVYIKDLDVEKKRISLGYKTQDMDSWYKFTQQYNVGDVVSAKIVSIMPFGAFAEVFEDVDGLIHISRISTERINSPADVLNVGDEVNVKIVEIDNENRKLALSIRALLEAEQKAAAAEARAAEKAQRDAERAEREAEEAAEAARLEQERADMAPYIVGSI